MKFKTGIVIVLLGFNLSASAEFQTVSRAYEIALSDFRIPVSLAGSASFKECADCEFITARMTPDTRFEVNSENVSLQEFRDAVFQIVDRAAETVIVLRHLESNTVVSVSIDI